jgi:hypothetical protein
MGDKGLIKRGQLETSDSDKCETLARTKFWALLTVVHIIQRLESVLGLFY